MVGVYKKKCADKQRNTIRSNRGNTSAIIPFVKNEDPKEAVPSTCEIIDFTKYYIRRSSNYGIRFLRPVEGGMKIWKGRRNYPSGAFVKCRLSSISGGSADGRKSESVSADTTRPHNVIKLVLS